MTQAYRANRMGVDFRHPAHHAAFRESAFSPAASKIASMPGLSIHFDASTPDRPWSDTVAGRDARAVTAYSSDLIAALGELESLAGTDRWAGFINYDAGGCFEVLPRRAIDDLRLPLLSFAKCDRAVVAPKSERTLAATSAQPRSNFSRNEYESAVQRCLDYIAAGDVFQINLSQRFSAPFAGDPWSLYERLRTSYPAEFGAFLDFGDFQLLSNSPELFLRVTELPDGRRRIVNRPIKGTRPNSPGMRDALLHSEKDKAELAMIVDLQRNDLGRICQIGSVKVIEPRAIESHPTVLHGVATIEGILRPEVTLVDILRATFPCGSVTGCPKIRAMQIIDELEPVRRGAYCGAIGWVQGRELELAVAIRTMTIKDGQVHIPVGGGIVADSDPAAEYEETIVKAAAMFSALSLHLKR